MARTLLGGGADYKRNEAYGWPPGSVRALLALAVFGGIWAWLWRQPERDVPEYLQNLMFIIMGHYFAVRGKAGAPVPAKGVLLTAGTLATSLEDASALPAAGGVAAVPVAAEPAGPPPLGLPRGSVRFLLVGGFVAVAAGLIYQRRLWAHSPEGIAGIRVQPGGLTLVLVGGFLLGVLLARVRRFRLARGFRLPRIVEDLRATVSLAAAALLLAMVFGVLSAPPTGWLSDALHFFHQHRAEDVLAAVVGFYFGSRS